MSDGKIVEIMKALKALIEAKVPPLKVEVFPGVFDDNAVKRFTTGNNKAHLAFLGASGFEQATSGETMLNPAFGIYLSTVGTLSQRTYDAINALEKVAGIIATAGETEGDGFDVKMARTPLIGEIGNLYGADAATGGVSIYGLTFAIPIIIGESTFKLDLTTLPSFQTETILPIGADPLVYNPGDTELLEPLEIVDAEP